MQETVKAQRFYELLEKQLVRVITQKHLGKPMTPPVLQEIKKTVVDTITGIFAKSTQKLSPPAMSWLCNQFFKRIRVSNDQLIDDLVVINEHKLSEMSLGDIELMQSLFDETSFGKELSEELASRKKLLS